MILMKQRKSARKGFSLIEMLVVIAIIGVLAALIAAAILRMLSVVPQRNTELLIIKLKNSLDQQWAAAEQTAREEAIPSANMQALLAQAGGDPQKARDLWVKTRLRQEFPQSFAEAQASGNPAFAQLAPGSVPANMESSVCLYTTLTVGRRGMIFDEGNLAPKELRPVGNGLKCIYDGWDQPIAFTHNLDDGGNPPKWTATGASIASSGADKTFGNQDDVNSDTLRLGK